MLQFNQPLWIGVGAVCCVLAWVLFYYLEQRRGRQLQRFAAQPLIPDLTHHISPRKRRLKKYLLISAILLCFIALARPQYGHRWVDVKHKGIDILFALDTSKSMLAEDIRPNRLERSKLAIMDFVSRLSGDRVGLLPFAGSSFLICPLTADYQAFEQTLMSLDQSTIADGGTDIGAAIETALATLRNEANHKFLVMITDGEELQGNVLAAARRASENGMVIHSVGVGTDEGELIPNPESGGFIQDRHGVFVKSRLDRKSLDSIAEITGGLSVLLGSQGQGLETVYQQKLALLPRIELAEKRTQVPIERFGWPVGMAIVLLGFELVLSGRKNGSRAHGSWSWLARIKISKKQAGIMVLLLATLISDPSYLFSSEAEDLYAREDYLLAGEHYQKLLEKKPEDPRIRYNSGTTSYKNNLFEEAVQAFDQALATDDLQLQEKSYFNRGNGLYRLGESKRAHQPGQLDQAITAWEQAVSSYEQALALNPDNEQARANRIFVQEKLDQLKEEQQNQKQEQQQRQESENKPSGNESRPEDNQQQKSKNQNQQDQHKRQEQPGEQSENRHGEQEQQDLKKNDQPNSQDAQESVSDAQQAQSASSQSSPEDNSAANQAAAQPMSREEAEQLLQSLKTGEAQIGIQAPLKKKMVPKYQDW